MSFAHLLSFLLLCSGITATPFGTPAILKRQNATPTAPVDPESTTCGDIVVASKNGYNIFFASDAYECLQSVPFDRAVAARFIDYYNETLQFQSTLALLKSPPEGYQQPPVDVNQVLEAIKANATAGVYHNQYEFEADVQLLINRIHDSHVVLGAGALQAFSFASPYGIVSASVDGKKPPEIFLTDHVIQCKQNGCKPSPVTHINGIDVVDYLTRYAELNSQGYLEPHADWNSLMDSPVNDILGRLGGFQSGKLYPGDDLNFTLQGQSPVDTYWLSLFNDLHDTGPLTTGGDFYNFFVLGLVPASYNATNWWERFPVDNSTSNDTSDSSNDSYPLVNCSSTSQNWCNSSRGAFPDMPSIAQLDLSGEGSGVVSGYIYDDISTGVLSLPTFAQFGNSTEYFQEAVAAFINNATAKNTSHIIIDLQQHEGGSVYLAFQTFKQLFPTIDPYAATRIRSHRLANILGNTYTDWWDGLEKNLGDGANANNYEYYASSEWVVTNRINTATGTNFTSWNDYSVPGGPVINRNDAFSNSQRYNLSDEIFDASSFDNWVPFGYGIAKPTEPLQSFQHWAPKDIVILTDGLCSSSCALFVEMMTHQAGVRTITVGGRPISGPMQAVAGTRGARVYSADAIDDDMTYVKDNVGNEALYNSLPNRSDTGMFITYAGLNIADQVRKDDPVPLQFKYEAADCRLYYTLANIYNMSRLWHDVAAAAWTDSSLCVEGSTANANNATRPPPPRTAQIPSLDLGLGTVNRAFLEVNSTGGLFDGQPGRQIGKIIHCSSTSQCGADNTPCTSLQINCGSADNPRWSLTEACTPRCSDTSDCTGEHTFCDKNEIVNAKVHSNSGNSQKSADLHGIVRRGVCKPLAGSRPRSLQVCGA